MSTEHKHPNQYTKGADDESGKSGSRSSNQSSGQSSNQSTDRSSENCGRSK